MKYHIYEIKVNHYVCDNLATVCKISKTHLQAKGLNKRVSFPNKLRKFKWETVLKV